METLLGYRRHADFASLNHGLEAVWGDGMTEPEKRYRGFVSYSQKDRREATRLHKALEAYRVPLGIEAVGIDRKNRRLGRFFRDDEEMAAATSLGAALKGAIADSEYLIVVCSPNAAQSRWVNDEIEHFRLTGRADNILAVIVDGEPNSAVSANECFPVALRQPHEPFALDVRKDGRARLIARLAAGLIRVPFDALWRRERRRVAISIFRAIAGGIALALAMSASGWAVWRNSTGTFVRAVIAASRADADDERRLRFAVLAQRSALSEQTRIEAGELMRDVLASAPFSYWGGQVWYLSVPFQRGGVAMDAYGEFAVTIDLSGRVTVLDIRTRREVASFTVHGARAAFLGPDGMRVATAPGVSSGYPGDPQSDDVVVFDVRTGQRTILSGNRGVTAVSFSPDSSRLITISGDQNSEDSSEFRVARVWSLESGGVVAELHGHQGRITDATFAPQGSSIATASTDGTLRIWDAGTGETTAVLDVGNCGRVAFSPDGTHVATGCGGVWEIASATKVADLRGHSGDITDVSFSPDGSRIVTSSEDGSARAWASSTGEQIAVLRAPPAMPREFREGRDNYVFPAKVSGARFSRDGTRIATSSERHSERFVQVWQSLNQRELVPLRESDGYGGDVLFSPDGSRVLARLRNGRLHVLDLPSGRLVAEIDGDGGRITDVSFGPDGSRIAALSETGGAHIWGATSGREVFELTSGPGAPTAIVFSPDGMRVLVCYEDGSAHIIDLSSRRIVAALRGHRGRIVGASFASDGLRVLTSSEDKTARIWDASSGRQVAVLRGEERILSSVFSPDGSRVLTRTHGGGRLDEGRVILWDASSGAPVVAYVGVYTLFEGGAFSPDGEHVVVLAPLVRHPAWWDLVGIHRLLSYHIPVARVLDSRSGREVAVLRGHTMRVTSAAFSPDSSRIITTSYDRTARVWDVVSGREIKLFRARGRQSFGNFVFNSDGTRAVTFLGSSLRMYETTGWREEPSDYFSLDTENSARRASFSPDGARLLVELDSEDAALLVDASGGGANAAPLERASLLVQLVCNPATGRLSGGRSIITVADVRAAPVLRQRLGQDVCARHIPH